VVNNEGQKFEIPNQSKKLVADLFTTQEQRDDAKREKVVDIPITKIDDFPEQPFQVKMDESMQNMVESVKAVGIQTPAIARQKDDGRYELISGHRRKMAATMAGLEIMPVIIRQMSRDEAIIALVDANLQREIIFPSEKAKSYKMKMDALNRQGERTDLTFSPVGKKYSHEKMAEESGESKTQIFRFIRLNELEPDILQMVDDGKIAIRPAVELSYLTHEQQNALYETMGSEDCTPSHAQAIKMREFAQDGKLNESVILSIMQEEKPNQKEQFKISREHLSKYFPRGTPAEKMQSDIIKGLELLQRQRERNRDAR